MEARESEVFLASPSNISVFSWIFFSVVFLNPIKTRFFAMEIFVVGYWLGYVFEGLKRG